MFNKKDILKSLHEFNYFIEESVLNNFIKNWKIDPIYEDEDGIEFFDNVSILKIKKGISLKSQGYDNDQIVYHLNKILGDNIEKEEEEKKAEPEKLPTINQSAPVATQNGDLKNFTIDVTSQTLQLLAEAVAQKITSEIKDQIQNSMVNNELLTDGTLKNDNQSLSKQVEELLDDNKKLARRIAQLETNKKPSFFGHLRSFFS